METPPTARREDRKRFITLLWWSIPVLFAAFTLRFVARYAVDLPFWDEWFLVDFIVGDQPFTLDYLWRQHNEHRIALMKVLTYLWARATHWNLYYQTFWPGVLITLGGLLVLFTQRRAMDDAPWTTRFLYVIGASACFASLRQAENLLWATTASSALALILTAAFVLAFPLALGPGRWGLVPSFIIVLSVANFSQGLALALYVVGFAVLELARRRPWSRNLLVLFVTCVTVLGVYFVGYESPPRHPDPLFALTHPGGAFRYALLYIGGSFSSSADSAYLYSAIALSLGAYLLIGQLRRRGLPILLDLYREHRLFAIGVITMSLVVIGRAGFGPEAALASRYTTLALPLVLGGWAFIVTGGESRAANGANTMVVLFAVLSLVGYVRSYDFAKAYASDSLLKRSEFVNCVRTHPEDVASCDHRGVFPDKSYLLARVKKLREHGLSFFSESDGRFAAIVMPRRVGGNERDENATFLYARFARKGSTPPGFLVYGPFLPLETGLYSVAFRMRTAGGGSQPMARIDVVADRGQATLARNTLSAAFLDADGDFTEITLDFTVERGELDDVEFRVEYLGGADLVVDTITLRRIGDVRRERELER